MNLHVVAFENTVTDVFTFKVITYIGIKNSLKNDTNTHMCMSIFVYKQTYPYQLSFFYAQCNF